MMRDERVTTLLKQGAHPTTRPVCAGCDVLWIEASYESIHMVVGARARRKRGGGARLSG